MTYKEHQRAFLTSPRIIGSLPRALSHALRRAGAVSRSDLAAQSRVVLSVVLLLVGVGCARSVCTVDPELIERVSRVRGIQVAGEVPCLRLTPAQVRRELTKLFHSKADPRRMFWEGESFRALRLIPDTFRYPDEVLDFYSERLLALYEPDGKRILVGGRGNKEVDKSLLAHELTHALQDQRYNVNSIIDYSLSNDEMMARSALLEGDANITAHLLGGALSCHARPKFELYEQIASIQQAPGRFPPALEMMTAFPYLLGERFVCSLRNKGGVALLERSYRLLPQTDREIAFPDEYLARIDRSDVQSDSELDELSRPSQLLAASHVVHRDSLGLFLLFSLIIKQTPVAEASRLAESWKSDSLTIETGSNIPNLNWELQFLSNTAAKRVAVLFRQAFEPFGGEVGQDGEGVVLSIPIRSPIPEKYR